LSAEEKASLVSRYGVVTDVVTVAAAAAAASAARAALYGDGGDEETYTHDDGDAMLYEDEYDDTYDDLGAEGVLEPTLEEVRLMVWVSRF
jgi:hypothetical protein